jgi:CHAT domain-containing protein
MGIRSSFTDLPEMVILSACQTGLGKSMEAGTAGLARSFLLGGSTHVIMSLWNVDDAATAYLMSRFVHHLQTPHRFMPAEPLRLAILDTQLKFKNPAQWASFSLFGIDY